MTSNEPRSPDRSLLPIAVRLAQPSDTHVVLDFTRATWDGWDYLPLVWNDWLESSEGLLLVAVAQDPRPGEVPQLDLFGRPFGPDRPIAVSRVAMLSASEAWLEALRVDPGVRNRGVAGLLHLAGLLWARAQGATVVRYATGEGNTASHRLGERHGFRLLRPWRSFQPPRDQAPDADDAGDAAADEEQPWDLADDGDMVPADVAARATARRRSGPGVSTASGDTEGDGSPETEADGHPDEPTEPPAGRSGPSSGARALARLRRAGIALGPAVDSKTIERWWRRIDRDETFALGDRLYEPRGWAFAELTGERFADHVDAGEVVVRETGGTWAAGILPAAERWSEGDRPWITPLVGDARRALELAVAVEAALRRPVRLRVPDDAPVVFGHEEAFGAAGFHRSQDTLHVLARELPADAGIEAVPAGALELVDPPRRVARPSARPRRRQPAAAGASRAGRVGPSAGNREGDTGPIG